MLSVIQYAFNAVIPLIIMILLGMLARHAGFLDSFVLQKINKFNFRFNFFALMIVNLYEMESIRKMPVRLGVFMIVTLSVLFILGLILSKIFTEERFRRGVLVQAMFRSNYAVVGIPVAVALVGAEGGQIASFLQFPTVMFYNLMSVLVLNFFSDYEAQYRLYGEGPLAETQGAGDVPVGKMSAAKILKRIVANPLIQGLTVGMIILILRELIPRGADGELVFCLKRDLPWLYSPLQFLSGMATPLALIVLGGQLQMKEIGGYKKELAAGVIMRLFGAPAVGFGMLYAAVRMGLVAVGPVEIAVLVAIFGSPMAVASIVMSNEMGGDGHLAGQIVAWTSILGMGSLFLVIFAFRLCGLL